jgi:Mrp family chromosome partitioning ATPase
VRRAEEAERVQPRPLRNAVLGLALGVVLGVGLAFLWEALDTRVRSAEDIARALGLPFLGRLPAPPKKLRQEARLVMLAQPSGVHAEAFRVLRTNLDFARLDREASTLLVTSAVEEEGKSTTAANLAIALARAGQRVALVDLDLRKPFMDRFFDLHGIPGITQVALGQATLDEALAPIAIDGAERRRGRLLGPIDVVHLTSANGNHPDRGSLQVLAAGPLPPNPGEFVSSRRLEGLLRELQARVDTVLIDSPPVLRVGDALTLSARVDGIVLVTRVNVLRRAMLAELKRLLGAAPSPVLGLVVTGADEEEGYSYGYADPYGYGSDRAREAARGALR